MNSNLKSVCIEILDVSKGIGMPAKNLRLQKLLYFVQAYSLISEDKKIFEEEIEAWPYGPVVPKAYEYYKKELLLERNEQSLSEYQKKLIKEVVVAFKTWSDYQIVDLTHGYELWKKKVKNIYGEKCMKSEEIKNYHLDRKNKGENIF